MESKTVIITQKDGYQTSLYQYFSSIEPKASILILHGMAEHHKRYLSFASFLNTQGIDVYLYDHRGHGTDKILKDLGYFGEYEGYKSVIQDAINILQFINQNKRTNKIILMGHSMGSLIARNVIQQYDNMNGVILSGTTYPSKLLLKSGMFLASIIKKFNGAKHRSALLNNIMFGNKAYTKLITRTSFDWLSRNNKAVGAYINDPYCGFTCTISFYHDLLKLAYKASISSFMKKTPNTLPIFIISGEQDPVGGYSKEIIKLANFYKKWEYHKIETRIYPESRHELLQELNVEEVINDITDWILKT
jgi:alpha-beta hydrolase superfamily lysophospholipase